MDGVIHSCGKEESFGEAITRFRASGLKIKLARSVPDLLTRQIPNPVHNTSTSRSLKRKRAAGLPAARGAGAPKDRVNTRCTAKRNIQTSAANRKCALELRSDSFKTKGKCRPKRKRWSSSISTTLWGSTTPIISLPSVIGKA